MPRNSPLGFADCIRATLVAFLLITIGACATTPAPIAKPSRPGWIDNPGDGAVGSSTTHVRGRHYQEELAIARARERLAARLGVTISSVQTIREQVKNDTSSVTSERSSLQVIDTKTVTARVRETWYDRTNDTVWVWLEQE